MTAPAPPGLTNPDTDPLPDPVALPDGIGELRRAVDYLAQPGYRPGQLDLYTPAGPPAPVIVFVHGGGWRVGTRQTFCPTWRDWRPDPFVRLVAAGFAVASVDYRLSGEATFPAQLDDVTAAARWLRRRGPELGVDATQMVAWGESAGGHLAALLGLTVDGIAGVVDWYGPADLSALPSTGPDTRESLLIGAPVQDAPELARRASPVTYVHAGAPPFHLAHGTADRFVPAAQSAQLADTLRAVGAEVELTLVDGADHMWMGAADPESIFGAAVAFARRVTGR